MNTHNISLPYPILSTKDDIIPNLSSDCITVTHTANSRNYYFDFCLKYDNDEIKQLIADGYAEYSCEIDCPTTLLRQSFGSKQNTFRISIPRNAVNSDVYFYVYISVICPITQYRNKNFNDDYGNAAFNMQPGDILAQFPYARYNFDIQYDKLQSAGSFMIVREGISDNTDFNFSSSKIEILLPHDLYEIYNNGIGSNYAEIMHASLAFNALSNALFCINEHKNTTWAKTILYRIEHEEELSEFRLDDLEGDIYFENPHKLAIKLLKDPFNRMLVYLDNKLNSKEE